MKTNTYITTAALLVALTFIEMSCTPSEANSERKGNVAPAPALEKFAVNKLPLEYPLQLPGELIANQHVDVYAKVTGFVKTIQVDIGAEVKAGQPLIYLEAPELASQLNAAESRLKSQEALYAASSANYKRLLETSKTPGTISPNDLDNAEAKKNADYANLDAARANYKEISEVRSYLVIRAPFAGVVSSRRVDEGSYVGPSGKGSEFPLMTIDQQNKLRLVLAIPEAYTSYVDKRQEVSFKVRSKQTELFKATLSRRSGALDNKLRTERLEFDIDNSDRALLPGTIADVTILIKSNPAAFVVPKSAVVNSAEGLFVIKVEDKKAVRVPVKRGFEANGTVEVFANLKEHDVLVLKGTEEIKAGQQVD